MYANLWPEMPASACLKNVCITCLTSGQLRKMYAIEDSTFFSSITMIKLHSDCTFLVCWECHATLVKIKKFRIQAHKAQALLKFEQLPLQSLSNLKSNNLHHWLSIAESQIVIDPLVPNTDPIQTNFQVEIIESKTYKPEPQGLNSNKRNSFENNHQQTQINDKQFRNENEMKSQISNPSYIKQFANDTLKPKAQGRISLEQRLNSNDKDQENKIANPNTSHNEFLNETLKSEAQDPVSIEEDPFKEVEYKLEEGIDNEGQNHMDILKCEYDSDCSFEDEALKSSKAKVEYMEMQHSSTDTESDTELTPSASTTHTKPIYLTRLASKPQFLAAKPQILASIPQLLTSKPQLLASNPQILTSRPFITSKRQILTSKSQILASKPQLLTSKLQLLASNPQIKSSKRQLLTSKPQFLIKPEIVSTFITKPISQSNTSSETDRIEYHSGPILYKNSPQLAIPKMLRPSETDTPLNTYQVRKLTDEEVKQYRDEKLEMAKTRHWLHFCYKCMEKFCKIQEYEAHLKKHDESAGPFSCSICELRFHTQEVMENHKESHYRVYLCEICKEKFYTLKALLRHNDLLHETILKFCRICDAKFTSRRELKKHRKIHVKIIECEICHKKISSSNYKRHVKNHAPQPWMKCDICQKEFQGAYKLLIHKRNRHGPKDDGGYCVECDISFRTKLSYQAHLKQSLKHVRDEEKSSCPQCSKQFPSVSKLKQHVAVAHENKQQSQCDICKKVYQSKRGIRYHIMSHHLKMAVNPLEKNKVCEICGKAFATKACLKQHVNSHLKIRPYKCEECGATFTYSGAKYTHIKLKHKKKANKPK